jgi:hypothetical protein
MVVHVYKIRHLVVENHEYFIPQKSLLKRHVGFGTNTETEENCAAWLRGEIEHRILAR